MTVGITGCGMTPTSGATVGFTGASGAAYQFWVTGGWYTGAGAGFDPIW
jgi:hypothetical protein